MSFIQNLFTSRDNNANAETYVGQLGRIWWDPVTNALYYSDGSTPGGIAIGSGAVGNGVPGGPVNSVQYNAGGGNFGGDAFFTIDAANVSTTIGNLTLTGGNLTGVIANTNIAIGVLEPGNGVVELLGPIHIHADSNIANAATFTVEDNGQVVMLVPTLDSNTGAVEIIGSASGETVPPGNPGTMLHVTGQNNEASRLLNDGINNYPLYVGRRYNGTAAAPTGVVSGDVVSRLGANPYLGLEEEFTPLGFAKIDFVATQTPNATAQGSRIDIYTTPRGSNTQVITASFDSAGILMRGNLIPTVNDTYSLGNATNKWNSLYIGPSSIFIEDSVLGTDAELTVSNGTLFINGSQSIQIGNMQMTTDGISLVTANTGSNIQVGASGDTGYMQINMPGIKFRDGSIQTTAAIPLTQKGNALGVVPLNSSTKIDTIYLPAGGPVYQGTWDADTNTPTLADGVGTSGDLYIVSVAGTQDLGSGPITFAVGDEAVYNGTIWQQVAAGVVGVTSFNTRTGNVTLTSGDVTNALSNGSITNNYLNNDSWSLTVGQGIGLTGNGTVELGDSITLTNTGVTAALAGTGVAVSAATGNVTFSIGQSVATNAAVQFASLSTTTTVQATGNITGGNIATGGRVVATGNIETSGYFKTPNTTINTGVVTTGNISGSYILGNGSQLTGIATSNSFSNVYANGTAVLATSGTSVLTVTPGNNQVITGNNTSKVLTIAVNDNPTFGNVSVTGNITISGNINTANTTYLSNVGNILFSNIAPLPTAQPGVMEYDGRVLYFTGQDQERGIVPNDQWYVLNADRNLTFATTTPQSLFGVGAHVSNSTRYWFRIKATVSRSTGTNNTAFTLGWRGSATMSKISYTVTSALGATSTPAASYLYETTLVSNFTNQVTVTAISSPPDSADITITGILEVGAAGVGYVDPYISWTGAAAAGSVTVSALSNFQMQPLGVTGANTNVGNWA